MILDFIKDMNGDSWEELCQLCYKIRYSFDNYREIPATYKGDGGIEGFTQSGIVNQCYYPEKEYADDEHYQHLRKKMTDDINKLINQGYKERLVGMGVPTVEEWHFVIPEYRDSRILEHAKNKSDMVCNLVISDTKGLYDYISKDFKIIVQDASNFILEIYQINTKKLLDKKVTFDIMDYSNIDWKDCESSKSDNIRKKVKAIVKDDDVVDEMVILYATSYLKGIQLMNRLRESYAELYEDIQLLANTYKLKVSQKTMLNPDSSKNYEIFMDILTDFEKTLAEKFEYIDYSAISDLQLDLIGTWLADCPLKFK